MHCCVAIFNQISQHPKRVLCTEIRRLLSFQDRVWIGLILGAFVEWTLALWNDLETLEEFFGHAWLPHGLRRTYLLHMRASQ